MCPECKISEVPHSGPSPVLIRPHELALVAPDWEVYSAWIEGNELAKKAFGKYQMSASLICCCIIAWYSVRPGNQ